jgi:PKD repeat protein
MNNSRVTSWGLGRTPVFISIMFVCGCILSVPAAAVHIPTVSEGLLTRQGCYVGAYLGGDQGQNLPGDPNHYRMAQPNPYETQVLDPGIEYGRINTGIATFRSGAGSKNLIFSRYVDLKTAPYDNNYEKIPYVRSPRIADWADAVIQRGGVPMIVLNPWSFTDQGGLLDLSSSGAGGDDGHGNGAAHVAEFAKQLDEVSRKYPDSQGRFATILIVFGQEFESHDESNPPSLHDTNGAHQQAFRRMFREASRLFHENANENVQMVWAGNVADTGEAKKWWWPGFDDAMNPLPDGDTYVDWVGQTRYHWDTGQTLHDMNDFYQYYSVGKNKPFIFTETSGDGHGDEAAQLSLSEDWISKLYRKDALYPDFANIKGIVWFDVAKREYDAASGSVILKNYLIPDGIWADHGTDQPGEVRSASIPGKMSKDLYITALADTYFLGGPDAGFVANVTSGDAPLTVSFTDRSAAAPAGPVLVAWSWDIDNDGNPDYSLQHPVHTYTIPGTYEVNLTITDISGMTDSEIVLITVTPPVDTLTLGQGWNFLSVPRYLASGNDTASDVFGTLDMASHSVLAYNASTGHWDQYHAGSTIRPCDGIWVYSSRPAAIPLRFGTEPAPPPSKPVYPGWNSIGFTEAASTPAQNALLTIQNGWNKVLGWNAIQQRYESAIYNTDPSYRQEILPLKGYWLYMNRTGLLS